MKKNAFTLVELSIVLVIIGLLVGGSFKVLKIMRERAQITRAQDDVKAAKEAVIGYAQMTEKLPTSVEFNANLSPVKNNQHQLLYTYGLDLDSSSDDICSFTKTDLEIQLYKRHGTSESSDQNITNVAFVIASEGVNHNMQTASIPGNPIVVKVHAPYFKDIDDNTSPINIKENYDDIVDWVTLSQLQEEAKCSDEQLRIINRTLPVATQGKLYEATLYVENNVTAIPIDCRPEPDSNPSVNPPKENNITFDKNHLKFKGTPENAGTFEWKCSANEYGRTNLPKYFVITVDSNGS